jgi:hypothetical protein
MQRMALQRDPMLSSCEGPFGELSVRQRLNWVSIGARKGAQSNVFLLLCSYKTRRH